MKTRFRKFHFASIATYKIQSNCADISLPYFIYRNIADLIY